MDVNLWKMQYKTLVDLFDEFYIVHMDYPSLSSFFVVERQIPKMQEKFYESIKELHEKQQKELRELETKHAEEKRTLIQAHEKEKRREWRRILQKKRGN